MALEGELPGHLSLLCRRPWELLVLLTRGGLSLPLAVQQGMTSQLELWPWESTPVKGGMSQWDICLWDTQMFSQLAHSLTFSWVRARVPAAVG